MRVINHEQSDTIVIKQVKPLIYNFFIKDRPQEYQESQYNRSTIYSHRSEMLDQRNHYFRPKLNCKKLIDDPMFLLTIQKKKMKVINGLNQRAVSQKPHRNFYKAGKLKTSASRTISVCSESNKTEKVSKHKRIESQQRQKHQISIRKAKPPNMQFNLKHLLQTTRALPQKPPGKLIKGNNLPYYSYYSSDKSPIPQTSRTQRGRRKREIKMEDNFQLNFFDSENAFQ